MKMNFQNATNILTKQRLLQNKYIINFLLFVLFISFVFVLLLFLLNYIFFFFFFIYKIKLDIKSFNFFLYKQAIESTSTYNVHNYVKKNAEEQKKYEEEVFIISQQIIITSSFHLLCYICIIL